MKRTQIPVMLGIIVAIILGGLFFYSRAHQTETPQSQEEQSLQEIRSREDIKKQQELIVKETYLLEQKAKHESEIANIETQLEAVRAEKTSFR